MQAIHLHVHPRPTARCSDCPKLTAKAAVVLRTTRRHRAATVHDVQQQEQMLLPQGRCSLQAEAAAGRQVRQQRRHDSRRDTGRRSACQIR